MLSEARYSKRVRSSHVAFITPFVLTPSCRSLFHGQTPSVRLHSRLTPYVLHRKIKRPLNLVCLAENTRFESNPHSPISHTSTIETVLKNVFIATTAGLTVLMPRQAIAKQSVITITDQVPNFTLPSQEEALRRDPSHQSILVKSLKGAKKVAPVVLVTVASVWALNAVYKRAQQQRLRDFQEQLRSSSYEAFGTDTLSQGNSDSESARKSSSPPQKQNRFKFRKREGRVSEGHDMSSKVKLDIFQSKGAEEAPKVVNQVYEGIQDAVPTSALERAIDIFITGDFSSDTNARKSALAKVLEARQASGLSEGAFRAVAEAYLSRTISAKLDRAVSSLSFDESESLGNLRTAVKVIDDAEDIDKSLKLNYNGINRGNEAEKEDLYRRYAVHCFTDQEKLGVEIARLQKLQNLLKIDQRRSEALLADVSKVMFQVAVSAAMMDGEGKDANMDSVKDLYESFGKLMDEGSADSITSEVAVMRIMYALQMLLQQEGSLKDVEGFGKMCEELGVDIDELISRAGVLEKTMGADATRFVDELREIVKAAGEEPKDGDLGQNAAVPQ
ncbi:unnamed protein product [Agarophyton chilense]|eukprot:gb/GEZJ01000948.1/.p3 GENE.gb/GEZJ01000948.1/~~gb/GEZJ01000948.1/.p3  ORF type:complete len:559 (-),score=103.14 gb/GEZJ01000948.1/:10565-12241(-)